MQKHRYYTLAPSGVRRVAQLLQVGLQAADGPLSLLCALRLRRLPSAHGRRDRVRLLPRLDPVLGAVCALLPNRLRMALELRGRLRTPKTPPFRRCCSSSVTRLSLSLAPLTDANTPKPSREGRRIHRIDDMAVL